MINALFWIGIGALSGWIGYLATRTPESRVISYLAIGISGGLMGGVLFKALGLSDGSMHIDTGSILNALLFSALLITGYVTFLDFFGNASSR